MPIEAYSEVLSAEGPHHTPAQQRLTYPGLQHTDFQTKWSGLPMTQLRDEPVEAFP